MLSHRGCPDAAYGNSIEGIVNSLGVISGRMLEALAFPSLLGITMLTLLCQVPVLSGRTLLQSEPLGARTDVWLKQCLSSLNALAGLSFCVTVS